MKRWLCCLCVLCGVHSSHADWPAFLGGQLRSSVPSDVPLQWSEEEGVRWQVDLTGYGQSSPVQIDDHIYLTAIDGPNKETNLVIAIDLKTGNELWKHESDSSLLAKNDVYTSRAAPTPVADAEGVYAFFESGNLIALTPSGDVRWQRDLISDYGKFVGRFGLGGSVAQLDDRIFVLADNEGPSYLAAFNKKDGEPIWKVDRSSRTSWSSPMILDVGGKSHVVVSSSGSIDGYDPSTGDLLWTIDEVGGNTVSSPLPFGDGKFLVGASPGRNGENAEMAKQSNMAVEVVKQGDAYTTNVLWRNDKATSSFGTPIVHGGHAYYTNRAGVLFCIDVETGETIYTDRVGDSNWATPIGVDDRVYIFGKSGTTFVIASGAEKKSLAENKLWTPAKDAGRFGGRVLYGVAPTESGFVIRSGDRLYLVGS